MFKKITILMLLTFALGWLCSGLYSTVAADLSSLEIRSDSNEKTGILVSSKEISSPADRISQNDIHVYKDRILISLENAQWSTFTDTNSMDPVLDNGANAIQVVPTAEQEINIGDIVSYESEYADGIIIHRVIDKGYDDEGAYFILKGDNNTKADPGKVRFEQIRRVVVAIIY